MRPNHPTTWILLLLSAVWIAGCTFDTAGLKDLSQNNVNNINNINNLSCGNNLIEGTETCDGTDLAGRTCVSLGYLSGTLACRADCTNFDASACVGATCGNGVVEGPELCDGATLAGNTCAGLGFARGVLVCAADCLGFDTTGCTMCGNDVIDGDELCDGANLAGNTCAGLGFAAGDLTCNADCLGFDTSDCTTQQCGNNHVEGAEVCDGTDLAGQTCVTQGFPGGTLACNGGCSQFVTSGCTLCGNNVIDGSEACDGTDLNGRTCQTMGCRVAGTPQCNAFCNAFLMQTCWAAHDEDGDGVDDNCDNCPTWVNTNQANADNDQVGNVCESPTSGTAPALANIHTFESFLNLSTIWTTTGGTWTVGTDMVSGIATNGGTYLHPMTTASNDYAVEVNFTYRAAPTTDSNWAGVVFGWTPTSGTMTAAYECVYERDSKKLQIYKYTTYSGNWAWRAEVAVTTSATDDQWRRIRGLVNGTTARCTYHDASGATADVSWSDPYFSNTTGFSGRTGLRLYNESANFLSFVYYTN